MSKQQLTAEYLYEEYVKKQRSTVDIAKQWGIFPEQCRRLLKKHKIPIRDKSTASKTFYENGGINPRKGHKCTPEEKEKTALAAKEYWNTAEGKKAKRRVSKASKKMWESVTDSKKQEIISNLHRACREASQEGSKSQKQIAKILREKYNYKVMSSVREIAGIGNLEVDIALPQHAIAIEVDGLTHYEDVFSDNRYERAQKHDAKKNNILTSYGWSVIRVRLTAPRYSLASALLAAEQLHNLIQTNKYNKKGVTYIDCE